MSDEQKPAINPQILADIDRLTAQAQEDNIGAGASLPPPMTGADRWAGLIRETGLTVFNIAAPGWHVQQHEVDALAAGIAPALEKYLPMDDDFTIPVEVVAIASILAFASNHRGQSARIRPVQQEAASNGQ